MITRGWSRLSVAPADYEGREKEELVAAEKAVAREQFRVNVLMRLLS